MNMDENGKIELTDEERKLVNSYLIFDNGDGYEVLKDLCFTFRDFKSDTLNEELSEIPHPYREYVKMGCRLVMDKIDTVRQLAKEQG